MDKLMFDTIIAFITFGTTRYALPNIVLNKPVLLWNGLVLSFFYALCALIRKYMSIQYDKNTQK